MNLVNSFNLLRNFTNFPSDSTWMLVKFWERGFFSSWEREFLKKKKVIFFDCDAAKSEDCNTELTSGERNNMTAAARVLIGGGSGFIGRRLIRQLTNAGYEPVMISRKPGNGRMTWTELYRVGLPERCEAVVNLAGENIGVPLRRFNEVYKAKVYDSRIETTKQLVTTIVESDRPPRVYVGSSAIGYYEPSESARYDEESPGGDFDFMSRLCRDWEAAAAPVRQKNVRHVTVRIGLALGREGGIIYRLYMPFFFYVGGKMASGRQWMPWIHVEDVVGILLHAIQNEHVHGVMNAVAPNCVTNEEFVRTFAKAMSRPTIVTMTPFMLNVLFGAERAEMMATGAHVLPKRTLESGYKFQYEHITKACEEESRLNPDPSLYHYD